MKAKHLLMFLTSLLTSTAEAETLHLSQAMFLAQHNDPWLTGSMQREQALEAKAVAASSLPDPMVSAGWANIPLDTFDTAQEPMTQFKVGVAQRFPRGNSRAVQQQKWLSTGALEPLMRQDRQASVTRQVTKGWLNAYQAHQAMRLVKQNRTNFEHLTELVEARYTSTLGSTRQHDLVRSQLELLRLDERLLQLRQQRDSSLAQLSQWLGNSGTDWQLPDHYPGLEPNFPPAIFQDDRARVREDWTSEQWLSYIQAHPLLQYHDQQIEIGELDIALAKQNYRPQWQANASYAYRQDAPNGDERADFLSFGIQVDLPIFTHKKQDPLLQAATAMKEAQKTQRLLTLRRMVAELDSARQRLINLNQRLEVYNSQLLVQLHQQSEAAITAYTNDDGDFAEVMRSQIDELNALIEKLTIETERDKVIADLNYYFNTSDTRPKQQATQAATSITGEFQ